MGISETVKSYSFNILLMAVQYIIDHKEEDLETLGERHGKQLTDTGKGKWSMWNDIENIVQKGFNAYVSGLNKGLDYDDG